MKIAELTFTVNQYGNLKIPRETLSEMGLNAGANVRVAFLSQDGIENTYKEFLLSKDTIDAPMEEKRISLPTELLMQAKIDPDADIQVLCANGAIILAQDPALNTNELKDILSSMDIATDILEQLSEEPASALEELRQFTETYEKGAYENDNGQY